MSRPFFSTSTLAILPVTALEDLQYQKEHLVLVGNGSQLEVHSADKGRLCKCDTFLSQAIHGIVVVGDEAFEESRRINLLVYGGVQVAWLTLTLELSSAAVIAVSSQVVCSHRTRDWILCAHQDTFDTLSAVVLTCHNALLKITCRLDLKIIQLQALWDRTSTFLYSGAIMQIDQYKYAVISGTAFGQILTWLCQFDLQGKTWQAYLKREYHGHDGSIFGVSISPAVAFGSRVQRFIATCSDDRTIRIWDASDLDNEVSLDTDLHPGTQITKPKKRNIHENALATTWAHSSRIWSVNFVCQDSSDDPSLRLFSTGEDGQAQSWSFAFNKSKSPNEQEVWLLENEYTDRHHNGKNIWAQCHSQDKNGITLYTGGGDGQIVSRFDNSNGRANFDAKLVSTPFKSIEYIPHTNPETDRTHDQRTIVFRSYLVLAPSQILVTTTRGLLLQGLLKERQLTWRVLAHNPGFEPYTLATTSSLHSAMFADSTRATLCLLDLGTLRTVDVCKIRSKKVSKLDVAGFTTSSESGVSSTYVSVVYFGSKDMDFVTIHHNLAEHECSTYSILLPETFEVTSTCYDVKAQILLCGSRAGAVVVYKLDTKLSQRIDLTTCRRHVHNTDTVTSIHALRDTLHNTQEGLFYLSTGRDGTYCVIRVDEDSNAGAPVLRLDVVHQAMPPFGPNIEGARLVARPDGSQRVLLYGFCSKQFVVWDETTQTQTMTVDCGGAHRSWSFGIHGADGEGGTFIWTRADTFMLYEQAHLKHKILRAGGHGREIKALTVHKIDESRSLVATGSEDTDIRLFEFTATVSSGSRLDNIAVIKRHNTGLQELKFSPDGKTLISAAGMEEMYAWRFSPVPVLGQGVVFTASLPRTDVHSDARIMSFDLAKSTEDTEGVSYCIVAAFSNGKVKVINYTAPSHDRNSARFTVLRQYDLGTICLTQASLSTNYLPVGAAIDTRALVGATNGFITLCTTSSQPSSNTPKDDSMKNTIPPLPSHKIHQNAITALQAQVLTTTHTLLITGGDDNALSFTLIDYTPSQNSTSTIVSNSKFRTITIPKAHAAALTTLTVLKYPIHIRAPSPQPSSLSSNPFPSPLNDPSADTVTQTQKSFLIITAGNDQRVILWKVTIDLEKIPCIDSSTMIYPKQHLKGNANGDQMEEVQIEFMGEGYTDVADVSAIEVLENEVVYSGGGGDGARDQARLHVKVLVVGVGMEVLDLEI